MGLADFMFGKKEKFIERPTMDPTQMALFKQLLGSLGGIGGGLGLGLENIMKMMRGEGLPFEQIEAPARRAFREQTIPSLAERFAGGLGLGGYGGQQSSAFAQTLGQAGAGLEEALAGQRAGMVGQQQQAGLQSLLQLLGVGIQTPTTQTMYRPATTGFLSGMMPGLGSALGGLGSMGLGKLFGFI